MSLTYSGAEPQPSLAWQFQSSNVDSVTGLTPSAQVSPGPAQLQGSAALVTNAPTSNTAVSFNGTTGYMDLGTAGPTNFNHSTSNLFLEAWVYTTNNGVNNPFYMHLSPLVNGNDDYTFTGPNGSGKFNVFFKFSTTSINLNTANTVPNNTWTHLAVSFVPGTLTAYVFYNGVMDGSAAGVGTIQYGNTKPTIIGNAYNTYFNGYIRDLRVVQGGVVPVANFTPGAAPFSYASPGYVANMGTTVFTLLGQFVTYNPSGKYNTSLVMGGQTRYVYTPPSSIDLGTSGATISLWLKSLASTYNYFLSIVGMGGNGNANSNRFYVYIQNNTSKIIASFVDNTSTALTLTSTTSLAVGTWTHMCFTLQNGVMTIYINGTNEASRSDAPMSGVTLDSALTIAARPQSPGTVFMNAEYDDLRIYNTALTAAQVQSVYSSQGAPAPSRAMPLPKLAWDFNGTMNDYISGVAPSGSNVATSFSSGKYLQSANLYNSSNLVYSNVLYYPLTTPLSGPPYTFSFWFKINTNWVTVNATQPVPYFSAIFRAQNAIAFAAIGNSSSSIGVSFFAYDSTNTSRGSYNPSNTLDTTNWTFASFVITSDLITIYIQKDGSAQLTYTITPSTGATFNQTVNAVGSLYGGSPGAASGTGPPFNGLIDDLRIFDRALTSAQVQSIYNQQGMPGRGAVTSNSRQIYVAPTGTYPSYTPTSGAQFPVFNTSNVSFYSSGGTSGGTVGRYLDFGSQTFNMSSGFSAVCQFAWTNGIGVWERIFDFGIGTNNNNILLTRTGTSTNLFFSYRIGGTEYFVTATGAISAQNTLYTVVAIYDPSKPLLSLYVNGNLTTSVPAVVARDTRTLTRTYVGRSNWGSDAYSNVNINYLSIYNRVLTPDEITPPLPTPQTTLKGTPLFTQLSTSATSSAVGAFSLRAVNGTSARAVAVIKGTLDYSSPPLAVSFTGSAARSSVVSNVTQASMYFPGNLGSYLTFTDSRFATNFKPTKMTFETWVNYPNFTNCYYSPFDIPLSFGTMDPVSNPAAWTFGPNTTGYLVFYYWNGIFQKIISTTNPLNTNTWYHIAVQSDGTNIYIYVNGVLIKQDAISGTPSTLNMFTIGQYNTYNNAGVIANFYVGDTRLVYGANPYATAGFTTPSAPLAPYTTGGATTALLLQTPSLSQDFYADRLGNLLTAPVVGQSLAQWLGGATGYVTTWYDQSGRGNHAIQNTAANQPIIQRATKGPGYMVVFNGVNGTTSYGLNFGAYNLLNNTSYATCAVVRRTAPGDDFVNNNANYYLSGSGGANSRDQYFHSGYRISTQLTLAHYSDDMGVTIPAFTTASTEPINYNFMTLGTDKVGRIYSYSGGTLYPTPTTTRTYVGFLNHPVGASLSIGGGFRQFTGEIYELLVFTKSLYDLDGTTSITQIYTNQSGYTGA